jgi:hypothetical protein
VGFTVRGLVTHARFVQRFNDQTRLGFRLNAIALLKRRGVFKSAQTYGPLVRLLKRRRYAALFASYV